MAAPPAPDSRYKYFEVSHTLEQDALYSLKEHRNRPKPSGVLMSVTNLVKAALGAGILNIHVGYKKGGWVLSLFCHILAAFYMRHCLGALLRSAQIIYSRTHISFLTYPQLGRAAFELSSIQKIKRLGRCYGFYIDSIICIYLFGVDAVYQLIMAKNIKKLVEGGDKDTMEAQKPGYPNLRMYLVILLIPTLIIVQFRHLDIIARFSFVGNIVVGLCTLLTVYYAFDLNPTMKNMVAVKNDASGILQMLGTMAVALSCCTSVVPIENNMKEPEKFQMALTFAMIAIFILTFGAGFFGYVAFLEDSEAPVTVNFPKRWEAQAIQGLVVVMIMITYSLNFWIPFELVFNHMRPRIRESRQIFYEHVWRSIICILVVGVAIVFPSVNDLVSFLGTFCVSNVSFILPNMIEAVVYYERPGYGRGKWRLIKNIILGFIGFTIFIIGTYNNSVRLFSTATQAEKATTEKSRLRFYENGTYYK